MSIEINVLTSSISRAAGGLKDAVNGLYKEYVTLYSEDDVCFFSYRDQFIEKDMPDWELFKVLLFDKTNFFKYSSELRKAVIASNGDILHIHGLWLYPHVMSSVWKEKKGKPVIISPHGMLDPYIIRNQHPIKRMLANFLFAKKAFDSADCYHALCKAELDAIRAYGIKKPVAIIPNGIKLPDITLKFEKKDTKKHLLFLGRLHPKKGVDMLLEAVGELYNQEVLMDNWVVDVVGWAQEGFDKVLTETVKRFGIENKVIFHGGLFGEEKDRMYAQADAYILPSHGEGLPLTVLEAWSWNTPVLMTPLCNIPEGFEAKAAIKIENNMESVKEGVLKLIKASDIELKSLADNGKLLVEEQFTWDIAASKMNQLYKWLLGKAEKPDFVYLNQENIS